MKKQKSNCHNNSHLIQKLVINISIHFEKDSMILLVHCNCRQQQTSLAQTLISVLGRTPAKTLSPSPPGDFELIDGPFAVVVVDEVFVTHADALLVSRDATICQVAHYAVKKVINISHCLPGPKGHVNLTMVLKQLGLTF